MCELPAHKSPNTKKWIETWWHNLLPEVPFSSGWFLPQKAWGSPDAAELRLVGEWGGLSSALGPKGGVGTPAVTAFHLPLGLCLVEPPQPRVWAPCLCPLGLPALVGSSATLESVSFPVCGPASGRVWSSSPDGLPSRPLFRLGPDSSHLLPLPSSMALISDRGRNSIYGQRAAGLLAIAVAVGSYGGHWGPK